MPVQKNIRYCRKQNGLSQKEFANELGISQSTIHSWESKRTFPRMDQVKQIAKRFNIEFNEFCDVDLELRDEKLTGGNPITVDEIQSVLKFRTLPDVTKIAIRAAINAAYEEVQSE